jgi:hypothetical protein
VFHLRYAGGERAKASKQVRWPDSAGDNLLLRCALTLARTTRAGADMCRAPAAPAPMMSTIISQLPPGECGTHLLLCSRRNGGI